MTIIYRQGLPTDAQVISNLVMSLAEPFFVHKDRSGAEVFLESISEASEARFLSDPRYWYWLAEEDGQLLGFIGIRDNNHIFHLFVDPACQKSGLGSTLVKAGESFVKLHANISQLTVNAAVTAKGFYAKQGFGTEAEVQCSNGVQYLPMFKPMQNTGFDNL